MPMLDSLKKKIAAQEANPIPSFLKYSSIFLLLSTVMALSIFKIESLDLWWHLQTGRVIFETHVIPQSDIYSYTVSGHPWIDSHWLFQVMLFAVYSLSGLTGVIIIKGIILVAVFALILGASQVRTHSIIAIFISLLALMVTYQRFIARPGILTLLFLVIFMFSLLRYKERGGNAIYILPLLMVIWVNVHGLHVLGVIVIFIFLLGEVSERILTPKGSSSPIQPMGKDKIRKLTKVLALSVCALAFNGNGLRGVLYPLHIFSEIGSSATPFMKIIYELQPPFSPTICELLPFNLAMYLLFFAVSALSFMINWKKFPVSYLLIYLAFAYLSLLAWRNASLFAVATAPLAARNFSGVTAKLPVSSPRLRIASYLTISMFCLGLIAVSVNGSLQILDGSPREFGVGYSERLFPKEPVDILQKQKLEGRIYHAPKDGGYLIFRLYPWKKVFIDSRWEVYGEKFQEEFLDMLRLPFEGLQSIFERYGIDIILGSRYFLGPAYEKFKNDSRWKIIYEDVNWILLYRKN